MHCTALPGGGLRISSSFIERPLWRVKGAAATDASSLDRRGAGFYIIGAIILGLIVWGIIELTGDDDNAMPNSP